jgi:hypothetical protein
MNVRFDTLAYVNAMEAAAGPGIPRPHAEAIAKGLADLVDKDLVTRDFLRSELAVLRSEFKSEIAALRAEFASQLAAVKAELRDEFRKEIGEVRKEIGGLELQIRALQYGGAIAAFALGAVVLLTRLL